MPHLDLWSGGHETATALSESDICVIGSGPAGSTVARELSGSGLRITMLESGDDVRRPEVDRLDEIDSVGRPRHPDQWGVRNRILGGSSHTWGGRCAPFDDIDFETRPWVPGSGWAFGLEDIEPYLERSAAHLGLAVGRGFDDDRFWALAGRQAPDEVPDPSSLLPFFWQFSRDDTESYPFEYMRFGRHLVERVSDDVTVVTGATVVRIDPEANGKTIRSVEFTGPDGRRRSLRAPVVVLCAGGVENARILLSSNEVTPAGLGNDRGLVGRYLMDHLRGPVAHFDPNGSRYLQKRFGRYTVRGRNFRAGLRLSPQIQRAEGLLNCAAWLGESWATDDPWAALRRIAAGRLRQADITALIANPGLLARGVRDYFIERNGVPRKLDALDLICMVEQRPDPDSRVTLSDRRDRFGVRLPCIDWRSHEDEARTMRRMAALLAHELPRMGLPSPSIAEWIRDGAGIPPEFVDVAHPTGTTRMSPDAAHGVVDVHCQVHGVDGLFVAGSSVFPTTGHCNPTQMIVALAIRLADHLRTRPRTSVTLARAVSQQKEAPRVLLTGATGRIGHIVLDDLLDRQYRVTAVTSKEPPPAGTDTRVDWRRFDFLEAAPSDYDELVAGMDAIVHLGAEIGRKDRMPRVNEEATALLAESAEQAGAQAFCYTSTVSVYGSGRRRTATEDAPVLTTDRDVRSEYWALDYVRSYGRTKLAGEHAIRNRAKSVRYVVLRPTVVVDVADLLTIRDWSLAKRALAAHRHAHHVYVHDLSDAIVWCMERALAGVGDPGGVETFNVSEDNFAEPTHAHFLRKAFAATGDRRFQVPIVPGIADWMHDFLRFRTLPLRNPLWRMRFPGDRLGSAGYRMPYGMAHAHALALSRLRHEGLPDA